jgi:hypothetical protein
MLAPVHYTFVVAACIITGAIGYLVGAYGDDIACLAKIDEAKNVIKTANLDLLKKVQTQDDEQRAADEVLIGKYKQEMQDVTSKASRGIALTADDVARLRNFFSLSIDTAPSQSRSPRPPVNRGPR